MALSDIKDAGILAGFVRWGWPYHGLCQGGAIGSSGKTIAQPDGGNAWLIDKGLPALDIAPGVIASELAEGREWRNYALISGGQVYGTQLSSVHVGPWYDRNQSYIHVDEAGVNWLVTVSNTWPGTNTVRIILSVVRFGHFERDLGAQTPITMYQDVVCEDIEDIALSRWVDLQDVWTNGSKALVCVFMYRDEPGTRCAIISAIEVELSGTGGTDGSDLTMSATEVKPKSELDTAIDEDATDTNGSIFSGAFTEDNEYKTDGDGCWIWDTPTTKEIRWEGQQGFINGYPLRNGYVFGSDDCCLCLYESDGTIAAYRFRYRKTINNSVVGYTDGGRVGGPSCTSGGDRLEHIITVSVEGTQTEGYYILKNDTVIDKVENVKTFAGTQEQLTFYDKYTSTYQDYYITYPVPYTETSMSWGGSLGSFISSTAFWPYSGIYPDHNLIPTWDSISQMTSGEVTLDDSTTKIGIYRADNIAAFYLLDTDRTYGTVATALGDKTTTETADLYFSWQRKTGDFSFSANPICWV
jgi:hypothetical protein